MLHHNGFISIEFAKYTVLCPPDKLHNLCTTRIWGWTSSSSWGTPTCPPPQDEQMRASQLYAFANLDVGLPKTVEGKEETMQAMLEPTPPEPTNQLPSLGALQGLLPPNITVPSGWKPGMPVELPTEFPVPPPGWKPGDPVPLPPFESLPVPRVEDQQLRPNAHPAVHKPPATIQVQYVELDIPDPDDDE